MIHRITPVNDVGPQCARLPPRDITLPRAREIVLDVRGGRRPDRDIDIPHTGLRRDEITLRKNGWISFGQPRSAAGEDVMEFVCD